MQEGDVYDLEKIMKESTKLKEKSIIKFEYVKFKSMILYRTGSLDLPNQKNVYIVLKIKNNIAHLFDLNYEKKVNFQINQNNNDLIQNEKIIGKIVYKYLTK